MTEIDPNLPEKQRYFTEDSNFYAGPLEPYNDRFIQFTALKQLGYPVGIQQVPVEEFPEEFFQDMEWERDNYPMWFRPLVHDPNFVDWIECPDVPGDAITSDDQEVDDLLGNHPTKLITQVDVCGVHMLGYDIDCFDKDELRFLHDTGNGLLTRDLLIGCFMTALERYADRKARGYQDWRDNSWSAVTVDDFIKHKIFEMQGFRPVSPEQLGAVAMDYYQFAEQVRPELLEFKRTTGGQTLQALD